MIQLVNAVKEEKSEIELKINDEIKIKASRSEIRNFIKNNIDEADEYITAGIPERADKLKKTDEKKKAILLNSVLEIMNNAERICLMFERLAYQMADADEEELFIKTDLFNFAVDIMHE